MWLSPAATVLFNHLTVVGVDADLNRVGINSFCGYTDINLSGIILGHIALVMIQNEMTSLLIVRMGYQGIADNGKALDGCRIISRTSLQK